MKTILEGEKVMIKSKHSIVALLLKASEVRMANQCLKKHYYELLNNKKIQKDCSVFKLLYSLGIKVISKNADCIVINDGETIAKVMYKHSFAGSILDFNSITLF